MGIRQRERQKEKQTMSKETKLVTKQEALRITRRHIKKPGVIDLNPFIELLVWEKKLLLWVLQERQQKEQETAESVTAPALARE